MPPSKIQRIVIEFNGSELKISHPESAMLTLAMLSLADAEIKDKLKGHQDEDKPLIIPVTRGVNVPYPSEPK